VPARLRSEWPWWLAVAVAWLPLTAWLASEAFAPGARLRACRAARAAYA